MADSESMSVFERLIDDPTIIVRTTYVNNRNDENAFIKILVYAFDMGKNWLWVQPQIVTVKPINKLHSAFIRWWSLVVINSIHEFSGICYHNSSERFFEVASFHVFR